MGNNSVQSCKWEKKGSYIFFCFWEGKLGGANPEMPFSFHSASSFFYSKILCVYIYTTKEFKKERKLSREREKKNISEVFTIEISWKRCNFPVYKQREEHVGECEGEKADLIQR